MVDEDIGDGKFITYHVADIQYIFPKFILNVAFTWTCQTKNTNKYTAQIKQLQKTLSDPQYIAVIVWYDANVDVILRSQVRVMQNDRFIINN